MDNVTPAKAAEWLKRNTRNRQLSPGKVRRFVRDLLAGNWATTHQSIGIAPSFVVDGQHRLTAIRDSGVSVEMNVTMYATDDEANKAVMAVDITDKRTPGDMLEIAGAMRKGTGRINVAVVRLLYRFVGSMEGSEESVTMKIPTVAEIEKMYVKEKTHIDWVVRALNAENGNKTRFNSVHRTAFAIAHMLDAERTERFAEQIANVEAVPGSVAQAWLKQETEGKFNRNQDKLEGIYIALRLLQCVILEEAPPKKVTGAVSAVKWFRTQITKIRSQQVEASAQLARLEAGAPVPQ